jgi:diguanylate cyclase (GGDEF)-like protein/PAS domain S-box-containing protein
MPVLTEAEQNGQRTTSMHNISAKKLLDNLFDGVYFVDLNRRITYWNNAAERITGYSKSEAVGSCCSDNLLRHLDENGRELCLIGCPLAASSLDGKTRESSVFLHHKLGHRVPVFVRTSPVRDNKGAIIGAVEIFSDNSSSMQILHEFEKLKQDVYLDPLTNVGNRRYGEMTLSTRIYELQAHDIPLGVLFMDIDHFKRFNDQYGHKTGDDVLVMVAKSISLSLRKMDVVARWGGEEFVVILPGASRMVIQSLAERIRILIEHSFFLVADDKLSVTVSIGATLSQTDDSAESIVNRADRLMYLSKSGGRNRVTEDEGHE